MHTFSIWSLSSFNTGTTIAMLVLFSVLVTFVWWAKGCFYGRRQTLPLSHVEVNTVVNFSLLHAYNIWLEITDPIGFYWLFPASCIRHSVALHDLFTFFAIANALFTLCYMLVQSQKPSQPIATYVQHILNASNRQMLRDLSHISMLSTSELALASNLSISSFRSGIAFF